MTFRTLAFGLAGVALTACVEQLATPGECPALCPGNQIVVRDTTITAVPGSDTSFFGYLPRAARTSLLVSNGLPAAEARAFVVFPKQRTDSIQVDGTLVELVVDTVAISFTLRARDSLATGLKIFLHRIPITTDTTATFAALSALLTAANIIDSIEVPDSVQTGTVTALLVDDELPLVATPADDSGQIGIGVTVRADVPTGVRFAVDVASSAAAPLFESRGRVDVADTARQRQRAQVRPEDAARVGYVFESELAESADPDLLYLGGPQAARALIRFSLPEELRDSDSAQVIRATLELMPAAPLLGLPNYTAGDSVVARGVLADLGAKSPPLLTLGLSLAGGLHEGTTELTEVDMLPLVSQWQIEDGPPPAVFVAHLDESQSFMQPVFHSTRSGGPPPRLRITFLLPSRPGQP